MKYESNFHSKLMFFLTNSKNIAILYRAYTPTNP